MICQAYFGTQTPRSVFAIGPVSGRQTLGAGSAWQSRSVQQVVEHFSCVQRPLWQSEARVHAAPSVPLPAPRGVHTLIDVEGSIA